VHFVVIGNGRMAIDCMSKMVCTPDCDIDLIIGNSDEDPAQPRLVRFCKKFEIPFINSLNPNDTEVIERIAASNPDYIFNIDSFSILRDQLLTVPKFGTINFHNGPLPQYAGVNVCSWAILNGESQYGVTWHFVNSDIDTGDIIAQKIFPMTESETAVSLVMKCIVEGVELFDQILANVLYCNVDAKKQERTKATHYFRKDRPFDGNLPLHASVDQLARLSRAIKFHPAKNNFYFPEISIGGETYFVQDFSVSQDVVAGTTGKVISVNDEQIQIAGMNAIISVTKLLNANHQPYELSHICLNDVVEPLSPE
jgi:methionyl-tRNA formyltransferase